MPAPREMSPSEWQPDLLNTGERDEAVSLALHTVNEKEERDIDPLFAFDIRLTEEDIGA